jgi:hypothetical protein
MRSKGGNGILGLIFMGVPHGRAGHHPEMKMDLCWLFSDQFLTAVAGHHPEMKRTRGRYFQTSAAKQSRNGGCDVETGRLRNARPTV